MKYRLSDSSLDRMVTLHMIGQYHDMKVPTLSSSQVARLMGVSVPTAIKRLKQWKHEGFIHQVVSAHRSNALKFNWRLHDKAKLQYQKGLYRDAYNQWLNEVTE